jgi:hypothetical protein
MLGGAIAGDDSVERTQQRGASRAKFRTMGERKVTQSLFAPFCERQQDLAMVRAMASSAQKTFHLEAAGEFGGAVMLELEAFGESADGREPAQRKALDGEERLMLLRFEAGGARGLLAEV